MKVICTRCGGTNIACEAIVNPNTGKIIDYLDESFMHANCGDCKEEVVITDVDRVKKDIDSMFFEFVKKNGEEPEYVDIHNELGLTIEQLIEIMVDNKLSNKDFNIIPRTVEKTSKDKMLNYIEIVIINKNLNDRRYGG